MKKSIRKSERGQAMVEMAIVLPVFLLLLLGVVQFGVAFNNYLTLTDAARAGARKAVVSHDASACASQVRSSASDLRQGDLTVSCSSSWGHGSTVTVTASYPYSLRLLGVVVKSGRLNVTTQERVE